MKIYTKTGDKGKTSLFGGERVEKHHLRIEAYGTIDELNAHLGLVGDLIKDAEVIKIIRKIQNELFVIGSMLATPKNKALLKSGKERLNIIKINDSQVVFLENKIDEMNQFLPKMTHFILPGGNPLISHTHIARCVCRRSERFTTKLAVQAEINPIIITYLNRLSDFLFVLARKFASDLNIEEIKWIPEKN